MLRRERAGPHYFITGVDDALVPAYYPVPVPPVAAPEPPPRQKRLHLPRTLWREIAERARSASLRDLAAEYGVSLETIRGIMRRMAARPREGRIA